jgi:hypothetical protein
MNFAFSPFIVPVGAFVVAIVAIVSGIVGRAHARRVKAEQRMAMLARGMSIPDIERLLETKEEEDRPASALRSLSNARRTAIVLVSSGVGLIIFFLALTVIVQERDVLAGAAAGLIPLAIGIGFFIDYNLQKRELSRFGLEADSSTSSSLS